MENSIFYYFACFLLIGFIAFIGFQKNVFIFGLILSFIYTIIQVILFSDLYNISNLSLILMFLYISILSIGTGAILRNNNSILVYVLLYILIFGFLVYISKIYLFPNLMNFKI